jgi:hypothetical protein
MLPNIYDKYDSRKEHIMAVNSKQKGNAFERFVANYLSERFESIVGKPKGFIRKPDSGSYFGGKNQTRIETHLSEMQTFGDIIAPNDFLWSIEAKHYKTPLTLSGILNQKNADLDRWIEQASQDAYNAGKLPLIIIKYNNVDPFVLIRYPDMELKLPVLASETRFRYKGWEAIPLPVFFSEKDTAYFK